MNKIINSFRGAYFFLSNFYSCAVTIDGITYQNNEAAFQAQKCINPNDRKKFANLLPNEAKSLGRRIQLRSDWEEVKYNIMDKIVRAKFYQNPFLQEKLKQLKGVYLEEGNTWHDTIWGVCNGKGNNYLGKILMNLCNELNS